MNCIGGSAFLQLIHFEFAYSLHDRSHAYGLPWGRWWVFSDEAGAIARRADAKRSAVGRARLDVRAPSPPLRPLGRRRGAARKRPLRRETGLKFDMTKCNMALFRHAVRQRRWRGSTVEPAGQSRTSRNEQVVRPKRFMSWPHGTKAEGLI